MCLPCESLVLAMCKLSAKHADQAMCCVLHALRILGLASTQIVYVESIARTRRFSLSAKLLYHLRMADLLFVQWEQLANTYPRAVFAGRLY